MDNKFNYDPNAKPLTTEELNQAKELIRNYPKVSRHRSDPPIANQSIANVSFVLLEKPQNGVYGLIKIRGVWPDIDIATNESEKIIRDIDSTQIIHQVHVGHWALITNNEEYTSDQMDVKTKEDELTLRDRAMKEQARKNQQKQREIQERKEELKLTKEDEDEDSLDYYTKKRVARKELQGYINQGNEKIQKLKKSLRKVDDEITKLDKTNPTFTKLWLDNYNKARIKAGLEPISESGLMEVKVLGTME